MLFAVPSNAGDIDDCTLRAVVEDTVAYEKEPRVLSRGNDDQRLEIGEAAYGVRERAPDFGPAAPPPPVLPDTPPQTRGVASPFSTSLAPGAALPPEMRQMPSLTGQRSGQALPPSNTLGARPNIPQVRFTAQGGPSYDQVVAKWVSWVRGINPNLTPQEADLIVRWTIYYCALNQVDHRLMFAVMKYESDFNPRCVSRAGAMGLTQLMPCNVEDFKVKDPFDIAENIRGGVEHLAEFLRKYQGRSYYEQTVLALACYNAGPGAVAKYGGVPPYEETQD
ncbi:MAG: lytic transglycosylase domain-containing protein, partial [Candidatus Zipacnadales bacterium]